MIKPPQRNAVERTEQQRLLRMDTRHMDTPFLRTNFVAPVRFLLN